LEGTHKDHRVQLPHCFCWKKWKGEVGKVIALFNTFQKEYFIFFVSNYSLEGKIA